MATERDGPHGYTWVGVGRAVTRFGSRHIKPNGCIDVLGCVSDAITYPSTIDAGWRISEMRVDPSEGVVWFWERPTGAEAAHTAPVDANPPVVSGDHGSCNSCGRTLLRPVPDFLCEACRRAEDGQRRNDRAAEELAG